MSNTELDFVQQLRQKLFGTTVPQPIPTITTDKAAQRTLVSGSDGKMRVQFQDANTGAILGDLTGYSIIDQSENLDWLTDPGSSDTATADAVTDPLTNPVDAEMKQLLNTGRGGDGNESRPGNGQAATVSNNFGYIDKSSLVGIAGLAPGPIGMGAKMLSTGINLNNVQAVNAARAANTLPSLDKGQVAGGVIGSNEYSKGYIGDVNIGDEGYAVSFGGGTINDGRTSLTPAEMRQRNELAGNSLALSTDEQKGANLATYEADDLDPDMVGQVANRAIAAVNDITRDVGSLFGWSGTEIGKVSSEAAAEVTPTRVAEAVRAAKTTAVDRAGLAPVGAIGRQREAVDQAPANASSVPTAKAHPAGLAGVVSNPDINPNAVDSRQRVAGEVNWGSVDPRQLDPGIRGTLENAASQLGFGFSVTSGYRDPAKNAAVGGAKKSAHTAGQAVDVSLKGLDEGQRTALVGTLSGIAEETELRIGAYSGNTALHVDTADTSYYDGRYGPAAPMFDTSIQNMDKAPGWFASGLANPLADVKDVPTPTPRDAVTPSTMTVEAALAEAAAKRDRQTVSAIPGQPVDTIDPQTATPAQLSNLGYGPVRSAKQMSAVARTLAGELSPTQLQGIAAKDPAALAEAANIVSTIENRAQSAKFAAEVDPISSVLGPSQYNANAPANAAVTDDNFSKYGSYLQDAVSGFYDGSIAPTAPDATHYYNADIANPAWGTQLAEPAKLGDHVFGSLPGEYRASEAVQQARDAYGHSLTEASLGVGFAGKANSPRSIDPDNNAFEGPDQSAGFAGFQGSPRSMSQGNDTDYSGNSSSGYAGKSGSARSVSQGDGSFDTSIGSSSSGSSGFAGSAGSPRSASRDDSSFDGYSGSGSGSKASATTSDRDYSGSSGSSGSGQQGVSKSGGTSSPSKGTSSTSSSNGGRDYSGSSGSSGSNQQGTAKSGSTTNSGSGKSGSSSPSGGFAGSAGSAAAASRGDSNVSGNGSSSAGGKSSNSSKSGGLGSW